MPSNSRYPVDPITLRISGVDWTYWKTVEISRQIDAIAGAFSITLADPWVDGAEALPIAAGMECELLIGGDPVLKGYIDKSAPSFSDKEHGITIAGRDKSADLVDCAAVHSPGHWINQTALQLAAILAQPFGVAVRAEADVGAPIPSFKLDQGESAFEALDRALKLRELLACPDGAGNMILLKIGTRQNVTALIQGKNIKAADADCDLTDCFSQYLVQGQKPGNDDEFGQAAAAISATAKDPAVIRYRPMIVRAENSVDAAAAKQRADWEKTVRAARSVSVSVTVQGFRQGDGSLWQLGALTDVDIPYLRLKGRLLSSKITLRRDISEGSVTVIELRDPAAFKPEPKTQETAAKGGAQKDLRIEAEKDLQTRFRENAERRHQQIKEGK